MVGILNNLWGSIRKKFSFRRRILTIKPEQLQETVKKKLSE